MKLNVRFARLASRGRQFFFMSKLWVPPDELVRMAILELSTNKRTRKIFDRKNCIIVIDVNHQDPV